jgi:hypothetical protein
VVGRPRWQAARANRTCFLMCIAIMLAHLVDSSAKKAAEPAKKE